MKPRHVSSLVFFAVAGALLSSGAQASAETWVPTAAGTSYSWLETANWSSAAVPNALGAGANVNNNIVGNQTIAFNTDVTLGTLNLGDSNGSHAFSIGGSGRTLTLEGASSGDATFVNLSTAGNSTNTISAAVVLGGSSNLTVTNNGTQNLTFSGGLSVGSNRLTLDTSNTAISSILISSALTGTGPFIKDGKGQVNLTANATYSGEVTINSGFFNITGVSSGRIDSTSITVNANAQAGVNQGGSALVIGNNSAGIVNRLKDDAVITLNGGGFFYQGSGTAGLNNEQIGEIVVGDGNANISINTSAGKWTDITMSTLTRSSSGTLQVRGRGLGGAVDTGDTSHIWITDTLPTMIGGGGATGTTTMDILPWAIGGTNNSNENTDLVTYDATGLRPLASGEYSNMASAGATSNVRDSVGGVTDNKTINALRYSISGTSSIAAGKTLTLTSGALVFQQSSGTIDGGTLNFAAEGVIFATSNNTYTIRSVIDGSHGITKGGTGILILSGANIYTGQTTVSGGVLRAGAENTLPSSTAVVLANTTANTLAGGFVNMVTALDLNNFNQTIGSLAGGGAFGGNVLLGSATLTTGGGNTSTTYAGIISGSGGLTKAGSGTFTLTGANTYTGATTINAGTLQIGSGGASGSIATTSGITNNATLAYNSSNNLTPSYTIGGSGNLVKNGSGTLTLNTTNTYTGTTTIQSGSLVVNGSIASSSMTTISSGGSLLGSGTVGALTIDSGGTINPGNSPGTLTVGNTTWNSGGNYNWQIYDATSTAGTGWDLLSSSGTLTIGATSGDKFNINLWSLSGISPDANGTPVNFDATSNYSWNIASFGSISGFSADKFNIVMGASNGTAGFSGFTGTFSISANGTTLTVAYTAPSSAGVWVAGSGDWSTAVNWQGNSAPSNGNPIEFAGSGGTSTNDSQLTSVNGLTFTANATGSYTVDGSALQIGGIGIVNNSTSLQTVATNLTMTAAQAFATSAANLTVTGAVDNGGFNLTLSGNHIGSLSGVVSGSGDLIKNDTGTFTMSASNTYSGATTINAGTLQIGGGGTSGSLNASSIITNNGTLVFNRSDTVTQGTDFNAAAISGSGVLAQSGSGMLVLNAANSYTGGTTINAGTIQLAVANALGTSGNITFGGGTLQYGTGVSTDLSSRFKNSTAAIAIDTNGQSVTYTSIIDSTNSGGLVKSGAGTLTLSAANTFTGGVTLQAGTLSLGNNNALGFGTFTILGGTIDVTAARNTSNNNAQSWNGDFAFVGSNTLNLGIGAVTLGGDVTVNVQASTLTLGGAIGDGGNSWGLTKDGAGILTLSGFNTFSGGVTLQSGTLLLGNNATLGTGALTISGGVLNVTAARSTFNNNTQFWNGDFTYGGSSTLNLGTGAVTLGGDVTVNVQSNTLTVGGAIGDGGNARSFTKNGAGTLVLSGASTYTGATTINAGNLTLDADNVLSDSTAVLINAGGSLNIFGRSDTIASLTIDGGALTATAGTLTMSGASSFTNNGSVTFFNAQQGRLNLNAAVSMGNFTFSYNRPSNQDNDRGLVFGADLSVDENAVVNFVNLDAGMGRIELDGDRQFSVGTGAAMTVDWVIDQLGGSRSLTKTSAGTLTLNNANTYAGGTNINGGTIQIGNANALGSSGTISFGGGTLRYGTGITTDLSSRFSNAASQAYSIDTNGNDITLATALTSSGGTFAKSGAGTLTLTGNNTFAGTTTISAGTLQLGDGGDSGSLASATIVNNSTLLVDRTGTLTLSGNMSGSGSLIKNGSGTLVLSGGNSYSGATTLNAGTLTIGNAAALGTSILTQANGSSLLALDTTGTISNTMSIYNIQALKTVTLGGGITVNNATFDIAGNETLTIAGGIGGSGGVVKNGEGTLLLSGSNSYSGATTVNAGTLNAAHANALGSNTTINVNGGSLLVTADRAIDGKNITLNSTATGNGTAASLAFSGTYNGTAGSLTLHEDSIIDLGTGGVVVHFTDLVMGIYNLSIFNWTGTTLWGGTDRNNTDQFYVNRTLGAGELDRISFFSGIDNSSFVGTGFQIMGGDFANQIIPVPEPETWATAFLLLLAGAGWLWKQQRQGKRPTDA